MKGGDTLNMAISVVNIGIITSEQLKESYVFAHRKMWNWIADETLKLKRELENTSILK